MSKMDRMLNSKKDKETIYEIYRACRLCGAGAGYKMPIIQNVVDLDDTDVELKQKVRECVQIEVHQDDKMPPLICELCVDKVNDFYEFLEMCRQTNKKTRLRLGLPPQSMPSGAPDAGDCILGLTEPVYVNDSDGEPLAKHKKIQPKVKVKKEPELKVKLEKRVLTETRPSRFRSRRSPTPPRMTRHSKHVKEDNVSLSRLQDKSKSPKTTRKSILKKDTKTEDMSLLTPRLKRSRDREPVKLETPAKKVKIAFKSSPHSTPKSSPKTSPQVSKSGKSSKPSPSPSPSPTYACALCSQHNKTPQALGNHMRTHTVTFTNPKLACNPCGLWFSTPEETAAHHKQHRSKSKAYNCRRCTANFKQLSAYDEHFDEDECIPWPEVPDVKCDVCWHQFPTNKLFTDHKCLGEDHRPGGKCSKCNRNYALLKNLKKHEQTCTAKKKGEITIDPVLLSKLRPFQVRVSRCDPLLTNIKQEHYDVSSVSADFGLDKNCVYPYISSVFRIKSELDRMVAINQEIKEEFCAEEYIHWDSEDSGSDEEISCGLALNPFAKKKRVDSLATLTLKTIFSQKCLGRVPRKRRRVKEEKSMFDSLLGETEDDVTRDINNIIDNLGNDDDDDDKDKSVFDDKNKDDVDGETGVVVDKSTDNDSKDTTKDKEVSVAESNDDCVQKNDQNDAQNDVSLSDSAKDTVRNDKSGVLNDNVSLPYEKDIKGANNNKNNDNGTCNDVTGSNNNINSVNNDDSKRIVDKVKVNNGTINAISVENNDSKVLSSKENVSLTTDNKLSNDENQNDVNDLNDDAISMKNEGGSINYAENSQDSSSVGALSESLLNDNTQSDVISENDKEFHDNTTPIHELNPVNNAKSHNDDLSIENGSKDLETNLFDSNTNDSTRKEDMSNESNYIQEDDEINDADRKTDKNIKQNYETTKKSSDSEDMDDRKLMEALDAEIGENNDTKTIESGTIKEKTAIDDLITAKNAEKSTDLDIISDEFNFET